jgi:hypothetical protein
MTMSDPHPDTDVRDGFYRADGAATDAGPLG